MTDTATATTEATRIGPMHEAFAAYVNENTAETVTAEQVFAVISNRVRFRKSDSYLVGVKQAKAEEKAATIAAKEEAAAERKANAAKVAAEKAAEKAKVAEEKAAAAKVKADEKAVKDAAAAEAKAAKDAAATESDTTEAPKKGKRKGGKSASADADKASDAPF